MPGRISTIALCAWLLAAASLMGPVSASAVFYDNFEPWWAEGWSKCAGSSALMEMSGSQDGGRPCHDGTHAVLAQPNWRYSYTACHALPAAYDGNVYLSVWVYDSADIPPGLPGPPDNPNWSNEHVPHSRIRVEDSSGFDYLHLACIGKNKNAQDPQWPQNIYFAVESAYEGQKLLNGPPTSTFAARREPGWRKWMIRVKPNTGLKGDVEYYLDGTLVYSGYRATGPLGPATYDRIGIGSNIWTGEWYWYDEVEFDYWPTPVTAASIAHALEYPDGVCVRMSGLQVMSARPDNITVSDTAQQQIDVYPARFQAPGDVVNVVGWLRTAESGRFIDTLVIEPVSTVSQITVTSLAAARALPDGTRVKLPERVVTASLGPVRFIQEANRTCGLKIRNIYEPAIGDKIIAEGQMMSVGPEKLLEAEKVTVTSRYNTIPSALGVPNRSLYQPNVIPSGMLVVTTGRVVYRPGPGTWYPAWFEMKDGSQSEADLPVRVMLADWHDCPSIGDYVWVCGAAGWLVEYVGSRPMIYTRYRTDLHKLQ